MASTVWTKLVLSEVYLQCKLSIYCGLVNINQLEEWHCSSGGGGCEIYLGHYRGTSWIQEITPICYANIAQLKLLELWINIFFGSHTSLNDCFGITGLSSLCTYIYCKSKQTYTMWNLLRQSLDSYVDNQKGFQALSWQNLHDFFFLAFFATLPWSPPILSL